MESSIDCSEAVEAEGLLLKLVSLLHVMIFDEVLGLTTKPLITIKAWMMLCQVNTLQRRFGDVQLV